MLYNDKETKEKEERFQELLEKTREFMTQHKEELDKQFNILREKLDPILEKEDKTPEEPAFLDEVYPTMLAILKSIQDMKLILGESIMRQSNAFYHEVKKLAAEGNEEAKKIHENLKPAYEAMLSERMNLN